MNNHVMLDLETIDSGPNAAILSIGACKFDPNSNMSTAAFYARISTQEQLELFDRTKSADTMKWWSEQTEQARRVFQEPTMHVQDALDGFETFCMGTQGMWGNGATFDNVILSNLYIAARRDVPWKFYHNYCFRTVKAMGKAAGIIPPPFTGTPHYALDDACHQAQHCQTIFKALNLKI